MKEFSFCVSMSTIPSRLDNISEIIDNINLQTLKPDKIFLNIPYKYKRFPNQIINLDDLNDLKQENLEIIRCEDYGPGTKIMGSIDKVRNFPIPALAPESLLSLRNPVCFGIHREVNRKLWIAPSDKARNFPSPALAPESLLS